MPEWHLKQPRFTYSVWDHLLNKFSDKKTGSGVIINEKLAEELHKPVIKKFKRRGVFAIFKDNI